MEFKHSFRTLFPVVLMLVLGPVFSGCVAMALVGAGSAGAYAISKDSIEGEVKTGLPKVYNASADVVKSKGMIKSEDKAHGKIEGVVGNGVTVKIELSKVSWRSTKIKVEARKNLLPNIEEAQEIYTAILKKVA
jgi:hypothetical protein